MPTYKEAKIVDLIGVVDGVNKTFTTPDEFFACTEKVIWNGVVYDDDDPTYGWTRIDDSTIEFINAPSEGVVLQIFYLEQDPSDVLSSLIDVRGGPFSPGEVPPGLACIGAGAWACEFEGGVAEGVIRMTLDPAGTSPPSGTVVRSQEEFDALGYDLRYPQDVLDILPPLFNGAIIAECAGGEYLAKPGSFSTGYPGVLTMNGPSATGGWLAFDNDSPETFTRTRAIAFVGKDDTTIQETTSGTTSGSTLTPDTGTWTINEHRGRFVKIISGPGAGNQYLIESNSTTALEIVSRTFSGGSVTFQILEPAAVFLPSTDGVNSNASGPYIRIGDSELYLYFDNIMFGKPSIRSIFFEMKTSGPITMTYCTGWLGGTTYSLRFSVDDLLYMQECYFNMQSKFCMDFWGKKFWPRAVLLERSGGIQPTEEIDGILNFTQGDSVFNGLVLLATDTAFAGCCLAAPSGIANLMFDSSGGYGRSKFLGNGLCNGFHLKGKGNHVGTVFDEGATLEVHDLNEAFVVDNGERMHFGAMVISGSNNTVGWKLTRGSSIIVENPQNVAATTEISIDGDSLAYSDVPSGSFVEGARGSRLIR